MRIKGFVTQPIHFVRIKNSQTATLKLITNSGKVNQRSRRILSELAGPVKRTKRVKLFHPRLLHMLQRVAERYPGRTIEIVSGYRPREKGSRLSQHNLGRAIDFRVLGVGNKELYNFISALPKAGTGYYPNSVFVHLDVRGEKTRWTDLSGQGEAPQYVKPWKKKRNESSPAAKEDEEEVHTDAVAEAESDLAIDTEPDREEPPSGVESSLSPTKN